MKSILCIRQSSIQPGLRHIEGYIETALRADPLIRTDFFDLVTRVRDVASPGMDRNEIIRTYRDYFIRTLNEAHVDAVLFMNGFAIESFFPGVMRELHARGVPMIAWHADDPYYSDLQTPIAPFMRAVLTVDNSTIGHWTTRGVKAHYLSTKNTRIGGVGAFQLVDDSRPDLFTLFPPQYLATFRFGSADSLKDAIRMYLADPNVHNRRADALAEIIRAEHTYAHRIGFIRGCCDQCCCLFARQAGG